MFTVSLCRRNQLKIAKIQDILNNKSYPNYFLYLRNSFKFFSTVFYDIKTVEKK